MYFRYYYNWHHDCYNNPGRKGDHDKPLERPKVGEAVFRFTFHFMDLLLVVLSPLLKVLAALLAPLSLVANPLMKISLPIIEPVFSIFVRISAPLTGFLGKKMIDFTTRANPSIFEEQSTKREV